MVRFYLSEEPILNNAHLAVPQTGRPVLCWPICPTWWSRKSTALGGYGMLVGLAAAQAEIEHFRQLLKALAGNYRQPTLALSARPTCRIRHCPLPYRSARLCCLRASRWCRAG